MNTIKRADMAKRIKTYGKQRHRIVRSEFDAWDEVKLSTEDPVRKFTLPTTGWNYGTHHVVKRNGSSEEIKTTCFFSNKDNPGELMTSTPIKVDNGNLPSTNTNVSSLNFGTNTNNNTHAQLKVKKFAKGELDSPDHTPLKADTSFHSEKVLLLRTPVSVIDDQKRRDDSLIGLVQSVKPFDISIHKLKARSPLSNIQNHVISTNSCQGPKYSKICEHELSRESSRSSGIGSFLLSNGSLDNCSFQSQTNQPYSETRCSCSQENQGCLSPLLFPNNCTNCTLLQQDNSLISSYNDASNNSSCISTATSNQNKIDHTSCIDDEVNQFLTGHESPRILISFQHSCTPSKSGESKYTDCDSTESCCTNQDQRGHYKPCHVQLTKNNIIQQKVLQSPIVELSFKAAVTPSKFVPLDSPVKLLTAKDKVFSLCNQVSVIDFEKYISIRKFKDFEKIGEGSFGEVFKCLVDKESVALKIVPVNGDILVNGQGQQSFEDVLTEIAIVKELSALRCSKEIAANVTSSFVELKSVKCCRGVYPEELLTAWSDWEKHSVSENDSPAIFDENQLYIIFEISFAGVDLERYEVPSVAVGRSIIHQVTAALAIAEAELDFEHRDLHWGNVLLSPTSDNHIRMKLDGHCIEMESKGIQVTIIDFTLSRLLRDGCVVYSDLEKDESLFSGKGDLQFDVYRQMREAVEGNWDIHCPKTNVLWIKYLTDKIIKTKLKKNARKNLTAFTQRLRRYSSAHEVLTDKMFQ